MPSSCCASFCRSTARQFDAAVAQGDLRRYRRKGPNPTTRLLRDEILGAGGGDSVLDIGAGIAALSLELLSHGFARALALDAAPAYVAAAREEAARREWTDRLEVREGDFVIVAPELSGADVVVLDRVVCCYPAYEPLLLAALGHSRRLFAFSYPHDRWYVRLMVAVQNAVRALTRNTFRTFVHPAREMRAVVEGEGFRPVSRRGTLGWSVEVYARGTPHT